MQRRAVLRGLVAAGGAGALAACLEESEPGPIPTGDPTNRPARQHAWNDRVRQDEHGNFLMPYHHVYLSLQYTGADREGDRDRLEEALTDLERAYEASNRGLLFTVGYSPQYFERFDRSLEGIDLPPPEPFVPGENVATDTADCFLHFASDRPAAVLAAEEALFGEARANDVSVTAIDDIFERRSRRTGFFGAGLPKERNDRLQGMPSGVLHDEAPFFMDFRSALRQNQATEDRVTLQKGRFAGGTTEQVSLINLTLGTWFQRDHEGQVDRLFSPTIDPETVGPAGLNLEDANRVEPVDPADLHSVAREHGVVGHAQKMAHLREDGRPPILRRDVNSDDNFEAGIVFLSLQRDFEDFRRLRLAMEGRDLAGEGSVEEANNNGILQYLSTRRRGNFLIPPRALRALPS